MACHGMHFWSEYRKVSDIFELDFHHDHGFMVKNKLRININKSVLLYSFILRVLFCVEQHLEVVCWFQLVIK